MKSVTLPQQECHEAAVSGFSAPAPRRILLIHNPTAGGWRARRFAAVVAALEELGCAIDIRPTGARGDAEAFARAASPADHDLVAVAGGDGTLNEAAGGLTASNSGLPLAIVPLGTANVLANEIGMPFDARRVARVLAEGRPRPVFAGLANGRPFLQMAGAGYDARVVATVDLGLKRRLGKLAYGLAMVRAVFDYGFPPLRVTVDGEVHSAASVIVAKGHFYGGRYVCCPDAKLENPSLEVCLFEQGGPWATLRYLLALGMGRLGRTSGVRLRRGRKVTIEGPLGAPVQTDGDLSARLPLTVQIRPEPLFLIYP